MAKICTISDESDTSSENEDTKVEENQTAKDSHSGHHLIVTQTSRGEQMARNRNFSINEDDFLEATDGRDGDSFRPRSRSAPPVLWAAKKYGRELRKMSDEFDTLLEKGMKRVRSAGTGRQMHTSSSWFNFLWSHQESDTENMSSLTAQNTRPGE